MSINRLVIFGDSFAYGQGLKNRLQDCYAGKIAQYFGWELLNLGVRGGSNETSKWELFKYQKKLDPTPGDIIMHGLTHPNRTSWIGNELHNEFYCNLIPNTIGSYNPGGGAWCKNIQKEWTKHCYSKEWEAYNNWHTVKVFETVAQQNKQKILQYYTYDMLDNLPELIPNFSIMSGNDIKFPANVFFDHGHLTEEGNQIVADWFIDYIQNNALLSTS